MLDVLIKNANIIDGTGKPAYKGSIGISGGKLVMADGSEEATAVIDASGKYVSPGWIDAPVSLQGLVKLDLAFLDRFCGFCFTHGVLRSYSSTAAP